MAESFLWESLIDIGTIRLKYMCYHVASELMLVSTFYVYIYFLPQQLPFWKKKYISSPCTKTRNTLMSWNTVHMLIQRVFWSSSNFVFLCNRNSYYKTPITSCQTFFKWHILRSDNNKLIPNPSGFHWIRVRSFCVVAICFRHFQNYLSMGSVNVALCVFEALRQLAFRKKIIKFDCFPFNFVNRC